MRTVCTFICALALLVEPSPSHAAVDGQDPQTAQRDDGRPVSLAADGALSVTPTPRLTLRAVLDDVASQAKFPVVLAGALEKERVSLRLRAVPLEEGLRLLLATYDVFYLFSPGDTERRSRAIKGVWVYPMGEGLHLQPLAPTEWASTHELERQLEDPDAAVRSDTFEALIARHGARSLPLVMRGLADGDDGVRLTTLAAALDAGVEISAPDLHALVLNDRLQSIRLRALEEVETRPEARAIAESVVDDPDPVVGHTARLLLERLQPQEAERPPRAEPRQADDDMK